MMLQRFFVFVFLFNIVGCLAMNEKDLYVEQLRDTVDSELLGLSRDMYFRSLRGSFWSFYARLCLTSDKVASDIQKINNYIVQTVENENDRAIIFGQLFARHWYVHYVMKEHVHTKLQEIKKATGSTVDKLWIDSKKSKDLGEKLAYKFAFRQFFKDEGISKIRYLVHTPMGEYGDIHWKVLEGHNAPLYRNCLIMSEDSKYLKSIDSNNNEIIWDMKSGKEVTNQPPYDNKTWDTVKWGLNGYVIPEMINRDCVVSVNDNYFATNAADSRTGRNYPPCSVFDLGCPNNIPVDKKNNNPSILLFQRQTKKSYFCQHAFYNSYNNPDELSALRESKTLQLVQGFPAENLTQRIENKLKKELASSKL
jgi:hypothetical protein